MAIIPHLVGYSIYIVNNSWKIGNCSTTEVYMLEANNGLVHVYVRALASVSLEPHLCIHRYINWYTLHKTSLGL